MRRAVAWKREQPYLALVPPPLSAAKTYSSSATGALGSLSGVAAGTETFSGTASGRLGALRGAAAGTEKFSGTASGHLGLLHGVASATYTGPGIVATAAGRLTHLAGNARGEFKPNRTPDGLGYWHARGLKPGDIVGDKSGRKGIVRVSKSGPYIEIITKGFIKPGKITDWKKYE